MGMFLSRYNSCRALFTALFLLHFPADGAMAAAPETFDPALRLHGYYEFSCGAVRFGKMGIELDQTAKAYDITSDIATTGVLKFFVPHKSHTTVSGSGNKFSYPDSVYESNYQTRNKKKYVKMVVERGVVHETLVPPETPDKRPPVAAKDKEGASDPLTFILRMRSALHDAEIQGKKDFELKYYDGRRLTLIKNSIEGKEDIVYNESLRPVVRVAMRRELLAGFTKSEIDDYSPSEPTIYAYFSDDSRLIPLRLQVGVWYGTLSANLVKECRTGESCLLGLK